MRILVLSNIFPPGFIGGYELGALDVSRALQRAGHDVLVMTSDYFTDDDNKMPGLPVQRVLECVEVSRSVIRSEVTIARGVFINIRNIRALAQTIIRFAPQQVICFNLAGLGVLGLIRYLVSLNLPTILYLMDDNFMLLQNAGEQRQKFCRIFGDLDFVDAADFILMSQNLCTQVESSLGRSLIRNTFIPGWFNPELPAENPPPTVSETNHTIRFVFASRIAGHKGINLALEAVRLIVESGRSDFVLDVFGAGDVGELLEHVSAHGLSGHITYKGCPGKAELANLLPGYDALIFPTWEREAFGFVVSEAAWAGCIPIMTAGIGAGEWFIDNFDSLKVTRNANDVAVAMLKVLSMCPSDRAIMGSRAQKTASRFLRFDRAMDTIEGVIAQSQRSGEKNNGRPRTSELAISVLDDMWERVNHG